MLAGFVCVASTSAQHAMERAGPWLPLAGPKLPFQLSYLAILLEPAQKGQSFFTQKASEPTAFRARYLFFPQPMACLTAKKYFARVPIFHGLHRAAPARVRISPKRARSGLVLLRHSSV